MWARVVEATLAVWLAISGLFLAVPLDDLLVWGVNLSVAALVFTLALLSYANWAQRAHVVTLVLGVALFVFGFVQARPTEPWAQNQILVGLLLAIFAMVPSHSTLPPRAWRAEQTRA
jgi:hypothetical protein